MPAEEGFRHLPSRIAQFYERAGYVDTLSKHEGSVTVIGAVFTSKVLTSLNQLHKTQNVSFVLSGRSIRILRMQDTSEAINWNLSYSEYLDDLKRWFDVNVVVNS